MMSYSANKKSKAVLSSEYEETAEPELEEY